MAREVQLSSSSPHFYGSPFPLLRDSVAVAPEDETPIQNGNHRGMEEEAAGSTDHQPADASGIATSEDWLPITESRKGNTFYAAFHVVCSGIGVQSLALPFAFTFLGWKWGIIWLSVAFCWQLHTIWLLVRLHESVPGTRYSRYLQLSMATFGPKLGKILSMFPVMYLSAGYCANLIVNGGGSMKIFYEIMCGPTCTAKPLSTVEWYVVFYGIVLILSQLPSLNSMACTSLIGATAALAYCTLLWSVSVKKGGLPGVSHEPVKSSSNHVHVINILNALGTIALSFRGHNLVLEIQGTMPSNFKHPSKVPMGRGVRAAYMLIACCFYPIAIAGFWAYGNLIPQRGLLAAFNQFHRRDTSRAVLGLANMLFVIHCICSFLIFAMPVFDNLEALYVGKKHKPCSRFIRAGVRVFFVSAVFFVSMAIPFLPDLAGVLGSIALPLTFVYPCFMWIVIKKPKKFSFLWCINWCLGIVGVGMTLILITSSIWRLADIGLYIRFFKAQRT